VDACCRQAQQVPECEETREPGRLAPAAAQQSQIQVTVKDPESGKTVKGNQTTANVLKVLDTFLEIPKSWPNHPENTRALLSHRHTQSLRSNFNCGNGEAFPQRKRRRI